MQNFRHVGVSSLLAEMDVASRRLTGVLSRSLMLPSVARPADPVLLHLGRARCVFSLAGHRRPQLLGKRESFIQHYRPRLSYSSTVCTPSALVNCQLPPQNSPPNTPLFSSGMYKDDEGGGEGGGGVALALGAGLLLCATGSGGI